MAAPIRFTKLARRDIAQAIDSLPISTATMNLLEATHEAASGVVIELEEGMASNLEALHDEMTKVINQLPSHLATRYHHRFNSINALVCQLANDVGNLADACEDRYDELQKIADAQ